MPTDPSALSTEEYRALRATIRERGTTRLVVAAITFMAWAALALAVAAWSSVSALGLLPLLVLVAGFEVVFAAHVGVERIGRYLQVNYEAPDGPPRWERLAMDMGGRAGAGSGIDPLFAGIFIVATLVNLIPVGLLTAAEGPTLPGNVPLEIGVYGLLHLLFIGRVLQARRFAAGQRQRDLALFKGSDTGH